ncbi:nucleolus and neural progenitor protein [Xyrichtys novacula]|uniref:Nucleolus and neural progenitor protein n=1 Tax=Xyrichtys novacula TaxID=13765 RepID=A0AAV1GCS8_XYRNO|nr:nucleolus and neural progenitor protein [Xyrichtys novacula]
MAEELWNRVNLQFPGAVSCVRIRFGVTTDAHVKNLLVENEKVLKLMGSESLQTEIRVLYELLYILKNSMRGHQTFRGLQQVEQCINKLKKMSLNGALQELKERCPNRFQRGLSIKAGECDVPSQPMLEWTCLKVLGASQLMSRTLTCCSRAFIRAKQQMKYEEFVILNVVITSMLSRLWVMFRGILCCLSALYQQLLTLLKEVAVAKPMPFLTDCSLPADLALFLGPSDTFSLMKRSVHDPKAEDCKRKRPSGVVKNHGRTKKAREDLGVSVERGVVPDADMKPFLKVFKGFSKENFRQTAQKDERKQRLLKQLEEASTFMDMETCLGKMIKWCKSMRMKTEKSFLTFLQLKCQKMKCLEEGGYKIQGRIKTFRKEACRALSPTGSVPKYRQFSASKMKKACLRTSLHSLRSQFKSSRLRTSVRTKWTRTELPELRLPGDNQNNRTSQDLASQATEHNSYDDIDDIFASVGL